MREVQWIKLATGVFDDSKIIQIESLPEGDAVIVIWFKLLCLAGNINDGGLIYFTKEIPFNEEMLAVQFRKPINIIKLALTTFRKFGMIEVIDDVLMLSNWEKYQNLEALEKIKDREQNRKRVADFRAKQKALGYTAQPDDIKEEQETTIKQEEKPEPEKKKTPASISEQMHNFTDDQELLAVLGEFVNMREKLRKKPTPYAFELLLKKLTGLAPDDIELQKSILNQSIINGWQDIFALKEEYRNKGGFQKKVAKVPDWYEKYEKDLKNQPKEEQTLSEEETKEVLEKANKWFNGEKVEETEDDK